ncbi:hypothetical protein [Algibacter sp. 2305UL17-15]|uniref:hypothetical protein n=1 Tax=Algibacter sp. 2305UL17-15 TaxID=3231268 RepID=UPI00345A9A20
MKKLGPIILGFIIGAVLTYYFCPRPTDDMHAMDVEVVKPKGVISVAEATNLSNNWTKLRQRVVDSITERQVGKKDYRSASWSLKDIEDYIAYSKVESKKLGYDMKGLRVYLGVYGEKLRPNENGLTTMFIVPTGSKSLSKAGSLTISLQDEDEDIPGPALNEGQGNDEGYP